MGDAYVLWTTFPRSRPDRDPRRSVIRQARGLAGTRLVLTRSTPLAEAARGEGHERRRGLPVVSRRVFCQVRFSAEREGLALAEDIDAAARLAARLAGRLKARRRPDVLLVLALTPPPVLVEHLWRESVWGGGTRAFDELAHDGRRAVSKAYERLLEVTAVLPRREVVSTCPEAVEEVPASGARAWQVSARGMEVLRRLQGHAANDKERRWMRDFCLQTFPRSEEMDAAVPTERADGAPRA